MLQADNGVPVATLIGALIVAVVSALFGYSLTRSGRKDDNATGQAVLLAEHETRLDSLDRSIAKLDRLQEQTVDTLNKMALQLEGLRLALSASAGADARITALVEDIRRIVDAVRSSQQIDHGLLGELGERVRALEALTRSSSLITPP